MLKNTKIGIYGKGYWGKILLQNLIKISKIKFAANSKTSKNYQIKKLDWCVVATPDNTRYKLVKKILKKKINVFCEKPLSRSLKECKELYELAKKNNVKLYVSDIELFRNLKLRKNFREIKIFRGKKTDSSFRDLLYKLMYHDLYLIFDLVKDSKINKISLEEKKNSIKILLYFKKKRIVFIYNRNLVKKIHKINNKILIKRNNLILKMFKYAFSDKSNFKDNKKRSLFCIKILNRIEKLINDK